MPKLTETFARKLSHSSQGTQKHWDNEVKGLVLFVGKRSKTWYYQKDLSGQTRRILIGRFPTITADIARQAAMGFALEMSRGAGKALQQGAPTLSASMDSYLERPKLRSDDHKVVIRNQFDLHLKDWLKRPLTEITKAMVVDRHRSLADRPSTANHTLKYFRTVWNHARRTHELPESPTVAIEWFDEPPNGKIIEDLFRWNRLVAGLPNPIHSAFYELLLYTGFRKSEALTLEWSHVHEDRLHLPMTKNGRSFDLPILGEVSC
jgi:hypothetical protein